LTNCTISGNKAYYDGGGIYNNEDEVTLTNCTISGNEAETRNGGGIYAGGYYQTITSSTPDDGSYSWSIPLSYDDYSSYKVKITDTSDSSCYYYSNSYFALYDGCAIHVTSPTGGENWELGSTHTITWTSQLTGGNVKIELYKGSSTLNMTNCTVSNNDADKEGGGIYNDVLNTLTLRCTIVYGNMAGDYGDDIMNLSIVDDPTDESIVGDAFGYSGGDPDPLLGPLQNNGGPTTTHALSSLSPAIDACINGCTVDTDQRGYPRPIDGDYDSIADCDVGAYEYIPPPLPSPSPVPTLSQWGMIGMCILLAAALVWSVRRRWIVSADKS
jgi:parallel beta-helix repeat protein